jgi:hypothetical protein
MIVVCHENVGMKDNAMLAKAFFKIGKELLIICTG